jgi:hypothetical protein
MKNEETDLGLSYCLYSDLMLSLRTSLLSRLRFPLERAAGLLRITPF